MTDINKTEKEFLSIKKLILSKSIKFEDIKKLFKKLFKNNGYNKM